MTSKPSLVLRLCWHPFCFHASHTKQCIFWTFFHCSHLNKRWNEKKVAVIKSVCCIDPCVLHAPWHTLLFLSCLPLTGRMGLNFHHPGAEHIMPLNSKSPTTATTLLRPLSPSSWWHLHLLSDVFSLQAHARDELCSSPFFFLFLIFWILNVGAPAYPFANVWIRWHYKQCIDFGTHMGSMMTYE